MTVTRDNFIDVGPVQMVPGAVPTLPLIRMADLSPREFAVEIGRTLDRLQFSQLTEDETRRRLKAAGFTDASAERAIEMRRRRQSIRVVS